MGITVNWPKFLAVSIIGSAIMLSLYMLWPMVLPPDPSEGYPARPVEQVKALLPFLSVVSITQLVVFCYLYLRVYPQRTLANAVWWGLWGGFFMVIPDGQFFVGTPNETWAHLFIGWGEGIVTTVLMTVFFHLVYRPKDEAWMPVKLELPRFLIVGAFCSILVFVLDLAFHLHLAQTLFDEYPAHDFPQRDPKQAAGLMWFLFLTYLFQLTTFCYLFLRVYPRRGMVPAVWFGLWLGVWVVIPNMEFFVGLDKYTWHMLAIQVPEGAILTMIMMAVFEAAYRPKSAISSLATAV